MPVRSSGTRVAVGGPPSMPRGALLAQAGLLCPTPALPCLTPPLHVPRCHGPSLQAAVHSRLSHRNSLLDTEGF